MLLLSFYDLALVSLWIVLLAGISMLMSLGLARSLIIASLRAILQLSLLGFVLQKVFAATDWFWVVGIAIIMMVIASYEILARQQYRLGSIGIAMTSLAIVLPSLLVLSQIVALVLELQPWYQPQYFLPLLGILLGNAMNGIAVGLNYLLQQIKLQPPQIEGKLILGQTWQQATQAIRKSAIYQGMIPMINTMNVAGIVSIPGMMTGQIMAGADPLEAAKYQMMILFTITAVAGLGCLLAVSLSCYYLFDQRHRLCLERLQGH